MAKGREKVSGKVFSKGPHEAPAYLYTPLSQVIYPGPFPHPSPFRCSHQSAQFSLSDCLMAPVINKDISGVRFMVLLLLGLLVFQSILSYFNTYLTSWLGQSVIRDMREEIFRHILRLRLSFFDKNAIGKLQTRAISDIETLNDVFSSGLVRIMGELLQLIAIFVAMLYTDWRLTLVVLVTVPLMLIATYIFKNKVKKAFQGVREAVSNMNAFLQEHISGMQIVHIFNREKIEAQKYDHINRNLRRAHLHSVMAFSIFFPVVEIISALGIALLVWYGSFRVMDGALNFGTLTAFIMFLNMFFRPIRMIADQFNILQMGMVSAERVFTILDTYEFIPDPVGDQLNVANPSSELAGAQAPTTKGISIEFKDVSFAYVKKDWVLEDINLKVNPGDRVALVGSTGSGKTTIINLLSRFL